MICRRCGVFVEKDYSKCRGLCDECGRKDRERRRLIKIQNFYPLENEENYRVCFYCNERLYRANFGNSFSKTTGIVACLKCRKRIKGDGVYPTWHRDNKLYWLKEKGGKCEKCGLLCDAENSSCFDFHHVGDKKFTVAHLLRSPKIGRKILEEELMKCIVLCVMCHRELHYANYARLYYEIMQKVRESEIMR